MKFKLLLLDIWEHDRTYEIHSLGDYADLMDVARRVEANQWPSLRSSRFWLLALNESLGTIENGTAERELIDDLEDSYILDKLLIWKWERK